MNVSGHTDTSERNEAVRRLQAVNARLRTFLQEKLKQFEAISRQCEEIVSQRDSLTHIKEQMLKDKGDWERRRQKQMDELRGEQDRLIEGWQKLEEEQRQILVQHDTAQLQGGAASSAVDAFMPSFSTAAPPAAAGPPPAFESKPGGVYVEARRCHGPAAVSMSRDSALEQFQRLKREIQKHVNRLRETPCANGNH
jgi:hypothetical protein